MTGRGQLGAALAVEWLKFRRARPVMFTSVFLVLGVPVMTVASVLSLEGANPLLAVKAEGVIGAGGWEGFFVGAGTISAVGGLLGFGVVTGWVFGREFTDGTVGSLFLAAVSRTATAAAKLLLILAWALAVAVALTFTLVAAGLLSGTAGGPGDPVIPVLTVKFLLITATTALLALPCAWAATLGRGYLAAIGAVIAIVVLAQLAAMVGLGGWFPFAAPGLWASQRGAGTDATTAVQVLLSLPLGALAAGLTLRSWHRLVLS
ncbi:MAG: hypothetical protein AVDCRST_MAG83-1417 [uncultured Arthrobacter sp.]|uniref:Uncharacterized protein n=1 Tax=uncultured Arthrobacter sp. TaxID=114050 RepID=A0A6J4I009_9MICC|nr:ABC transporter permease [uncultured Arthrobacter sp.]CAA9236515.1 MAG: hypothetical protein AVDCRST_MAG83-1417 [uncultured Arthrobacter sp.]